MFDLVGQSDHDKFSAFSSLHFSLLKSDLPLVSRVISDLSLVQFAQRWSLKSPLHPMPMPKPIKSSCNYKIWSVKCFKEIFQNHICVRVAVRTKAIADISSISINPPGRVPGIFPTMTQLLTRIKIKIDPGIFPTMTQLFNKNKNKDRSRDVPENGPAKIVNIITF